MCCWKSTPCVRSYVRRAGTLLLSSSPGTGPQQLSERGGPGSRVCETETKEIVLLSLTLVPVQHKLLSVWEAPR